VAILDADKEGFLRSHRSLTQTAGRAARNVDGRVIMYADTVTESMRKTIDETARRRMKQLKYNEEHHITPRQIVKNIRTALPAGKEYGGRPAEEQLTSRASGAFAADPIVRQMTPDQLQKSIEHTRSLMEDAARRLDFLQAAQYRDELVRLMDSAKR